MQTRGASPVEGRDLAGAGREQGRDLQSPGGWVKPQPWAQAAASAPWEPSFLRKLLGMGKGKGLLPREGPRLPGGLCDSPAHLGFSGWLCAGPLQLGSSESENEALGRYL